MELTELRNPYDYATPVRDADLFEGRGAELARVDKVLFAAGPHRPTGHIAIHGPRAAGKTSLLNRIEDLGRGRGAIVVRVDLVDGDEPAVDFFAKFYEELIGAVSEPAGLRDSSGIPITARVVRRIANGQAPGDDVPLEFPESIAHARGGGRLSEMALRTDLETLAARVSAPIVILVDEAQVIAGSTEVLSILRILGMQLTGYIFVLAGTSDLLQRINEVFDPLVRQFEIIAVEPFRESDEVRGCVLRPLNSVGLEEGTCFNNLNGVVMDLMELTSGSPYEIQLYCHTMFARWQAGESSSMELSPETQETVRARIEAGRASEDRPVLAKIRKLSDSELITLNILCAANARASEEELWFAYRVAAMHPLTWEEFCRCRERLIAEDLIEIRDEKPRFSGDHSERIYARLWSIKKLEHPHHFQSIATVPFSWLLSRRLDELICDLRPDGVGLLRTCCMMMDGVQLERGLEALETLPDVETVPFMVRHLYGAILDTHVPAALDITAVTCSYQEFTATRWLYSADELGFDLEATEEFIAAQATIEALGGTLTTGRTRFPLPSLDTITDWIASTPDDEIRAEVARMYNSRAVDAYGAGEAEAARADLETSYRLAPSWRAANNYAYISLKLGDADGAYTWITKAIETADTVGHRILSRYNLAITYIGRGDYAVASAELDIAENEAAGMILGQMEYLFVPRLSGDKVVFDEQADIDLSGALATAAEIARLCESLRRMRSAN